MEQSEQKNSSICVWDFTLYEALDNEHVVIDELKLHCKKWCFQLEQGGTTGAEHYQGRFSLKVKARKGGVLKLFKFKKWHISITSSENRDNNFYVEKSDTRIKGPWCDKDEIEDIYIPRDIRGRQPRGWQIEMINMLSEYNERIIDVLIDTLGENGKTWLGRYMMCQRLARKIPLVNDCKDLMRMVMDMPKAPCYIIDMPRSVNKDRLYQFWGGIEEIKNGYAYDDRYKFKDCLFDPPRILIVTNMEPDTELMSRDRWRFWMIRNDKLVKYESCDI